jgi:hypothetical protein
MLCIKEVVNVVSRFCMRRGEGESGYNVVFGEIRSMSHKSSFFKAKERIRKRSVRLLEDVILAYNNPIFVQVRRGERNVIRKVVVDVM